MTVSAQRNSSRYHVPNLEKALALIELLGQNPKGLTKSEIVEKLGLSTNITYRIASTLVDTGYLSRDETSKKFCLTTKLLDIGCTSVDEHSIANLAWGVMQDLRDVTKETVLLGVRLDTECIIIDHVPGLHHIRFVVDIGVRSELHGGAPGKCFLAFLDKAERERIMAQMQFTRYTAMTITSKTKFSAELETIRRNGYSVDRGEVMDGIHCVAAPVFDQRVEMVASIWVTAPKDRMPQSSFPAMGKVVKEYAMRLSKKLGYTAR